MNWDMITKIPGGGFYIGKEGGVLNAIVGSLYIAGGATVLGLLISIPVAIFINMYLGGKNFIANALRIAFDVLVRHSLYCLWRFWLSDHGLFWHQGIVVRRYCGGYAIGYPYIGAHAG